jgi:2-polyprenyl-3-methyl-5-hydroxy-6-metoxy-1,4-benzoquinol methylase
MRMQDYMTRYDSLASEESLYEIPLRKEYLLEQIGRGKRVLDVGCLGGRISQLFLERNNEVWGVEINPAAARAAEART